MSSGPFKLVIKPQNIVDSNDEQVYLVLDTCSDKSVTSELQVMTHPIYTGEQVADHIYRLPSTFTISGEISLNGSYDQPKVFGITTNYNDAGNWRVYGNSESTVFTLTTGNRLTSIQEVFESIQKEGILCDLTTLSGKESLGGEVRFKTRNNMVLKSISWKEKQNTMTYNFTFVEAMMVNVAQYDKADEEGLPDIYYPEAASLGLVKNGLSNDSVLESLIKYMIAKNYIYVPSLAVLKVTKYLSYEKLLKLCEGKSLNISDVGVQSICRILSEAASDFDEKFLDNPDNIINGVVIGAATGGALGIIFAGVGTIPGMLLGALAGLLALGTKELISINEDVSALDSYENNAKLGKLFDFINNSSRFVKVIDARYSFNDNAVKNFSESDINISAIDKFILLFLNLKTELSNISEELSFYSLSGSETDNDQRTVVLSLGTEYYYLTFSKKYLTDEKDEIVGFDWKLSIKDQNLKDIGKNGFAVCSNIIDCEKTNTSILSSSDGNYDVYLINPYLDEMYTANGDILAEEYLCNYYILVSKGKIEDSFGKIKKYYNEALSNLGY